jgi:hypothetical protein
MRQERRTNILASSISMILFSSSSAFAGSNPCVPLGSLVDGWAGDCAGGGFDSIEFAISKPSYPMIVTDDITANATPGTFFYPWSDVTLRGNGVKTNAAFVAYSDQTYQPISSNYTFNLHEMTLDNINLELRYVDWNFNGADNKLTLKNGSRLAQDIGGSLNFLSTSPMTITSESGDNEIYGLDYNQGAAGYLAPMTINVDASSSLKLSYLGNVSGGADDGFWKFSGTSTVNVDGGTLEIFRSRFDFEDGAVNLSNSSELKLDGFASELRAKTLNADSASTLNIGRNTQVKISGDTSLTNGTINLEQQARMETARLLVDGNSIVSGDTSNAQLRTQVIEGANGAILNVNDINILRTDTLIMANGFDVNIDNGTLQVLGDAVFNGGTINLTGAGQLNFFDAVKGTVGAINNNGSGVTIEKNASLELFDSTLTMSLTGAGELTVLGEFYSGGGGPVIGDSASSTIRVKGEDGTYQGIISPGSEKAGPGRDVIGTLVTDSELVFDGGIASYGTTSQTNLLNTGLFDGGYYKADLRLNGTTPENDLISYGDGDVNIAGMKAIQVHIHGNPTAAQLDGKEFTILAAQDSASAGQFITLGQAVDIEEDASVPILIDFFVADNQTNSKEDITLVAEEQLPVSLRKHPNVSTSRNRQGVAGLMPTAATGSSSQTPQQQQAQTAVHTALQSTTNAHVQASFTSVHPEPISSNMTVQLEQADNMLNTVLSVNTLAPARDEAQNLGSYFFGSSHSHPTGTWANINYVDGKVDGQNDLGSFNYYLTSYTFGTSFIRHQDDEVGAFFGFSTQAMNEHDDADIRFDSDAHHFGLYGGHRLDEKLSLNWAFGHGWLTTDSRRVTSLGDPADPSYIRETAEAEYETQLNYLGLRAFYDTSWLPALESSLFAGLAYLRADQEAFSEDNAPNLGLTIDRMIAHSEIVSLGVELSRALATSDSTESQTHLRSEVRYDYDASANSDDEHDLKAAFSFDPSNTQSFVGQNRGQHSVTLALGVDHEFEEDWLLSLAGAYTHSSHGYEVGGDLVMNWYW